MAPGFIEPAHGDYKMGRRERPTALCLPHNDDSIPKQQEQAEADELRDGVRAEKEGTF